LKDFKAFGDFWMPQFILFENAKFSDIACTALNGIGARFRHFQESVAL